MELSYVTAGESHGPGLTVVVSGLPAGLELDHELIRRDLARRQAGYGRSPRQKLETDDVEPRARFGGVLRAHGIAVHCRHRLGWLSAERPHIACQNAVVGGIECDHLLGQRLAPCENGGNRIGNRHQGHGKTPNFKRLNPECGERSRHVLG